MANKKSKKKNEQEEKNEKKELTEEEKHKRFVKLMLEEEYSTTARSIKANVFTDVFERKKYALRLVKIFHPEMSDITIEDIDIITLKIALMNAPYNDLGLLVKDKIVILVEAQSTWSDNILIRILIYLAYTYKNYILAHGLDVYQKNAIQLPKPEFYVVYTGDEEHPKEIKFSEKFFGGADIDIEIKATVIRDTNNPERYIAVPMVSSETRKYLPIAYFDVNVIPTNQIQTIPGATLYHFGVLESLVHMAWMRVVAGRLKSDYRYSKDIVYNNFIWPSPNDKQKSKIEATAQAILDARDLYPNSSLADLYDPLTMPAELLKAHRANDEEVLSAYGFSKNITEEEIVAKLMQLYNQKIQEIHKIQKEA